MIGELNWQINSLHQQGVAVVCSVKGVCLRGGSWWLLKNLALFLGSHTCAAVFCHWQGKTNLKGLKTFRNACSLLTANQVNCFLLLLLFPCASRMLLAGEIRKETSCRQQIKPIKSEIWLKVVRRKEKQKDYPKASVNWQINGWAGSNIKYTQGIFSECFE